MSAKGRRGTLENRKRILKEWLQIAAGLFVASDVEGYVHMALKTQLAVPVGLAVADQDQLSLQSGRFFSSLIGFRRGRRRSLTSSRALDHLAEPP